MLTVAGQATVVCVNIVVKRDFHVEGLVVIKASKCIAKTTYGSCDGGAEHDRTDTWHKALIPHKPPQQPACRHQASDLAGGHQGRKVVAAPACRSRLCFTERHREVNPALGTCVDHRNRWHVVQQSGLRFEMMRQPDVVRVKKRK